MKDKNKVLKALKKALHIIGYISTIVLVLLLVLVGVTNCQKQDNKAKRLNANLDNSYVTYNYVPNYDLTDDISLEQQNIYARGVLDVNERTIVRQPDVTISYDFTYQILTDANYGYAEDITRLDILYVSIYDDYADTGWYYRIDSIGFNNFDYYIAEKDQPDDINDFSYNFHNNYKLIKTDEITNVPFIEDFFTLKAGATFTFNEVINSLAPLGANLDALWAGSGEDYGKIITYDVGLFYCNGRYYDKVVVYYVHASNYSFLIDGHVVLGDSHSYAFTSLNYHPVGTTADAIQGVNFPSLSRVYNDGNLHTIHTGLSHWNNAQYRLLEFVDVPSDTNINNLQAFNNADQTLLNNGGFYSNNNLDVFSLLASAFASTGVILNTYLLPGITIGTLMFIPLVVIVVFAIIKVVKK